MTQISPGEALLLPPNLMPLLRASACTQHTLKLCALVARLQAPLALGRLPSLRKCHWGSTAALEELDFVKIMSILSCRSSTQKLGTELAGQEWGAVRLTGP